MEAVQLNDELRPRAELLGCPICGKFVPSVSINAHVDEHVGASVRAPTHTSASIAAHRRPRVRRPSSKLSLKRAKSPQAPPSKLIDLTDSPQRPADRDPPTTAPAGAAAAAPAVTIPSADVDGLDAAVAISGADEPDWMREERLWRESGRCTEVIDRDEPMAAATACRPEKTNQIESWAAAETAFAEAEAEADAAGATATLAERSGHEVMFEVVGWRHALAADPAPENPSKGDVICVARQPDNPRDSMALVVQNESGQKLGFLRRELAAVLSPLIDAAKLHLTQCTVYKWSDHGSCVMRGQATGELPPAAGAFEVSADPDDDTPRDQFSEFCSICRVVLERDHSLFTSDQHHLLTRVFALPAASCSSTPAEPSPSAAAIDEDRASLDDMETAARLAVRLFNRKGPWFRIAQRDGTDPETRASGAEMPWSIGMPWVTYPRLAVGRAVKVLSSLKLLQESPFPSDTCPPGADAEDIIAETIEWSRLLDKEELAEVVTHANLARVGAPSGSGSGSREGMRAKIAAALRLQLAPPSKGSIRNYFKSAPQRAESTASAGVLVTDVRTGQLRSQLRGTILSACGPCIKLEPAFVELMHKVELLFYLESARLGEPNTIFLLERIGRVKFAPYVVHPTPVFADIGQLDLYMEARRALEELESSADTLTFGGSAGGSGDRVPTLESDVREQRIRELVDQAAVSAAWLTEHSEWDRDTWDHTNNSCLVQKDQDATLYTRRFTAGWIHARIVHHAVHLLEAKPLHDHSTAVEWLRKLLRSPHCPSARPRWWNRLSIDLAEKANLNLPADAWAACADALTDPWLADKTAPEYGQIRRRFLRLSKKLGRAPTIVRRTADGGSREVTLTNPKVPKPTVEVIRGGTTNGREPNVKSTYWGYDDEMCSVEQLALQHYSSEEGGGWVGVHDEGAVLRTLFGLCLWPAIFANIPGVFQTKFQSAPLDLSTDAFYPARRTLIEALLSRVISASASLEAWSSILGPVWEKYEGCCCVGVSWTRLGLSSLIRIAAGFGGEVLAKIFRRLAVDYSTWAGGLPDLLLWQPPPRDSPTGADVSDDAAPPKPPPRSKLCEVKSQRDRPSEKQSEWITALASYGCDAVFLHVTESETAQERAAKLQIRTEAARVAVRAEHDRPGKRRKATATTSADSHQTSANATVLIDQYCSDGGDDDWA